MKSRAQLSSPALLSTVLLSTALLSAVACGGNLQSPEVPRDEVPPPPPDALVGAAPRAACVDEPEETAEGGKREKKAPTAGPGKDLALLLPPKPAAPKPIAKSTDLKKITVRLSECVRPRAEVDIASLDLPPAVPRAELPADLHPDWDKRAALATDRREVQRRIVRLDRRRDACERERCAKRACLEELRNGALARGKTLEKELADLDAELVKKLGAAAASGGTSLALGYLLEGGVRRGDGDPTTELRPVIAAYEAAKGKSTPESEIGWFARYRLALVYDDVGMAKQARAEWSGLAAAPPRGRGTAEVQFRVAEREPDPARAAAAFERALAALSPEEARLLEAPFTYRLLRAQSSAGRYADAVATAIALLGMARDDDPGLAAEAIEELALALDGLAETPTSLPSLPEAEWKKVAAALSREAFARFDPAAAAVAQKAAGASSSTLQPPTEAAPRMNAVARSCGYLAIGGEGGEIEVRVVAMTEGRAQATAKKRSGDAQVEAAAACIARRAPAYFVGAPAGATATIAFSAK
ncbi:MAG: hypothetical protein JST00_01930 [Deltaproteobacteria bacterium]|nr:hypothetical protein [Deltaproteobacteria bacterium]